MGEKIVAPWDQETVDALNAYQRARQMHPFTCAEDHATWDEAVLTATPNGWHCPTTGCEYRQFWAHAFMAVPFPGLPTKEGETP